MNDNPSNEKIVLGIETSCDDTSLAIIKGVPGHQLNSTPAKLLSFKSFSQEILLRKWGGVVPELAARNHLMKLTPLLKEVLDESGVRPEQIDWIGVTCLPGLLGPLLTGINVAKSLSLLHQTPINPVNHLFAHLEAIFLTPEMQNKITYPYLGLLVSGGHSGFFLVETPYAFQYLGGTVDDAAGEAFDKAGKMLGIGYPAGKIIDDLAQNANPQAFTFPIGLKNSGDVCLSYSGVKTSLRQMIETRPELLCKNEEDINRPIIKDLCASYQHAIIEALRIKTKIALKKAVELTNLKDRNILPIVVGGGVAANSELRKVINSEFKHAYFVAPKYCTDNGAMIANYALRSPNSNLPFPECLKLDAASSYIQKTPHIK